MKVILTALVFMFCTNSLIASASVSTPSQLDYESCELYPTFLHFSSLSECKQFKKDIASPTVIQSAFLHNVITSVSGIDSYGLDNGVLSSIFKVVPEGGSSNIFHTFGTEKNFENIEIQNPTGLLSGFAKNFGSCEIKISFFESYPKPYSNHIGRGKEIRVRPLVYILHSEKTGQSVKFQMDSFYNPWVFYAILSINQENSLKISNFNASFRATDDLHNMIKAGACD